eukprot:GHUV01029824.1.p1 GENE.GHUV01029824.1~~GHUV01029824.1.p1  ORF type:complete len:140 (+),score=4.16 GHUV01029824.1:1080-1499(+)
MKLVGGQAYKSTLHTQVQGIIFNSRVNSIFTSCPARQHAVTSPCTSACDSSTPQHMSRAYGDPALAHFDLYHCSTWPSAMIPSVSFCVTGLLTPDKPALCWMYMSPPMPQQFAQQSSILETPSLLLWSWQVYSHPSVLS